MKQILRSVAFPMSAFAIALVLMFAGDAWITSHRDIDAPMGLALWTLSALPFAVSLYCMRCKTRTAYGLFELMVGLALSYFTILGLARPDLAGEYEKLGLRMVTIFVLVFFLVRALDNIGEGLNSKSQVGKWWNVTFPKPKKR